MYMIMYVHKTHVAMIKVHLLQLGGVVGLWAIY